MLMVRMRVAKHVMPKRVMHAAASLFLVCALSACGYHLRGTEMAGGKERQLYVSGPAWLVDEIDVLVESSGGEVFDKPAPGLVSVLHRSDEFERRIVSVDSDSGKTREIEVVYNLIYDLKDGTGKTVLQNERISLFRDLTIDPDAVLGKVTEESLLQEEMRRDAASQIVRRMDSVLP